jgi:hypothetical protein
MDFYAKKYTVLMNNEPVEIWIKNDQVKKAKFMDKEIDLKGFNKETLNQIKENPSRIVNGNNLIHNENFTSNLSKVIDAKLTAAINKRDMKTLSRFARSDLVPESQKRDFYEAINQPRGIRGLITKAVNKINERVQKIAQKIDNYLINQRERIANQKMDKYLSAYQLKEFNKAPPSKSLDLNKNLDPNLSQLAKNFIKGKGMKDLSDSSLDDKILQEEFFKQALRNGHSLDDAKTAIFKEINQIKQQEESLENISKITNQDKTITDLQETIKNLEQQIQGQKIKEASKNETLKDFETLSSKLDPVQKIDILTENKEYQSLSEEEKLNVEDKLVFNSNDEHTLSEDMEVKKETNNEKDSKYFLQRQADRATKRLEGVTAITTSVVAFQQIKPIDKEELNDNWKLAQTQNRNSEIPSQKFMNLSAVKFNGVSETSLKKWEAQMNEMREKGKNVPSQEKVKEFIQGSLKNASKLEEQGILKKTAENEYKFVDEKSKEKLYNQELSKEHNNELKDALKEIASDAAFAKIVDKSGEINIDRLHDYTSKLEEVSTQMQLAAKANDVEVTREDLQNLNKSVEQSQSATNSMKRERA